ncbi:hypothetical protein KFE25_001184 [Diacronema lutheri]|uniref:Uncharacterized protein n=1 Tax=Diacronema lutheri TaxID=2081491 RepID=A0A8J5XEV3_DIALT|nr:hypothetical protein KFE25_001184 [Diacronema lutheri]
MDNARLRRALVGHAIGAAAAEFVAKHCADDGRARVSAGRACQAGLVQRLVQEGPFRESAPGVRSRCRRGGAVRAAAQHCFRVATQRRPRWRRGEDLWAPVW